VFEGLSERLGSVFDRLKKRGALSESDVSAAMREVRVALLEADVALPVVKSFIDRVRERAIGQEVIKSVTPGQMVVKIVHDELVATLGSDSQAVSLNAAAPVPILMVGLQGGGKTTTTAKLARRLKERDHKKVLMASLDVNRPAAMEQLEILGKQIGVDTLPIVKGEDPVAIAKRAKTQAALGGYDVYMLDTAGRLSIDEELMAQVEAVRDVANPRETLLVVDGLTGQDAVHTAENFDSRIGITGVVLTRMDGDGRGGAALSMRAVTGKPIKFVGLGEKMDALETFEPDRVAGRILGMGDIVALVEKAQATLEAEQAERMMKRFTKGQFNMNDLKMQLEQMIKMGGMEGMMSMLPGAAKMAKQMDGAGIDDRMLKQQIALINSMTKKERANPQILQASRKKRIAAGAGMDVSDLNKLLKMQRQMSDMMKKMGKMGKGGMLKQAMKGMFGKGGMPEGMDPSQMDPKQLEAAAKAMGRKLPGGMGGMGGMPGLGGGALPPGLSGFGKKK
jgi:signal recognition particle subunit SRP54